MRRAIFTIVTVLCSTLLLAQAPDASLQSKLEALHAKWFQAFEGGNGSAMDQLEMDNLALIMPTGEIWAKTKPRAGVQHEGYPETKHTLSDVSVRRFGDTAILTGVLTSTSPKEGTDKAATTVVFVMRSGTWKIASAQWTPVTNAK